MTSPSIPAGECHVSGAKATNVGLIPADDAVDVESKADVNTSSDGSPWYID
jgi:hypothetical protein